MHEILEFIHVIGVVLGVGGATVSDLLFFKSIKDGKIDEREFRFMKILSKIVWTGFAVLIFSGVSLFILMRIKVIDPRTMYNPGIWAHIIAAAVILFNGLAMHWKVFPLFESLLGKPLFTSDEFIKKSKIVFTTGAVSITSWYSAVAFAATRKLGFPLFWILAFYAFAVVGAVIVANVIGKILIKRFSR